MAGKFVHDYPSDDDLVAEVTLHGGVTAYADHLGIPRPTLDAHIGRRGLREKIKRLTVRPVVTLTHVPVNDPERLRRERAEAELKELRRENREYQKQLASQEALFDRIVEVARIDVEPPVFEVGEQNPELPERSVILPIFDVQYGQMVRPEDTPANVGLYSTAIFDERLSRYVDGVTRSLGDYASSHKITELVFILGGDLAEGDEIFPGQPWQLEIDPPRQVYELNVKFSEAITRIVRYAKQLGIPRIALYAVPGNHGKVGGKRGGARPATYSWDWLASMLIADRLRAEPIDQFGIEPGGALFFGTADHIFLTIHGDEVRGWGGLPFYGLTRFDGRMIRMRHTIYHYLLMGHHHQPATIPNGSGESIVSGDWVGGNQLSRFLASASRPQQSILFVAGKWGITETARIYFTEAAEAQAAPEIYGLSA